MNQKTLRIGISVILILMVSMPLVHAIENKRIDWNNPKEAQQAIKDVKITVTENPSVLTSTLATERCTSRTASVSLAWAWTYNQRIDWCYDGTIITRWVAEPQKYASSVFPTWTYDGVMSTSLSGGKGNTYFRAWSQAKFHYNPCIGPLCVKYYPRIDQKVYGNGGYWQYVTIY